MNVRYLSLIELPSYREEKLVVDATYILNEFILTGTCRKLRQFGAGVT